MDTRRKISIAKEKMERIKENRKLTKRGRKNRAFLEKECRKISVAELVNYVEKNKMLVSKLKRGFRKKKTMEESRVLNRQFQEDPGRVYDVFNGMLKNTGDQASEQPKYKTRTDISGENKQVFENIDEASG